MAQVADAAWASAWLARSSAWTGLPLCVEALVQAHALGRDAAIGAVLWCSFRAFGGGFCLTAGDPDDACGAARQALEGSHMSEDYKFILY